MGACASVAKSMRAEATETAPAPEQPKEETPVVAVEETTKAVEVPDVVVEDKKVPDDCDKDIVEGEAPKEAAKEEEPATEAKTEAPEPVVAPKEEEKSEVAPPPASVEAEAPKEEEKKTEVEEQK